MRNIGVASLLCLLFASADADKIVRKRNVIQVEDVAHREEPQAAAGAVRDFGGGRRTRRAKGAVLETGKGKGKGSSSTKSPKSSTKSPKSTKSTKSLGRAAEKESQALEDSILTTLEADFFETYEMSHSMSMSM